MYEYRGIFWGDTIMYNILEVNSQFEFLLKGLNVYLHRWHKVEMSHSMKNMT